MTPASPRATQESTQQRMIGVAIVLALLAGGAYWVDSRFLTQRVFKDPYAMKISVEGRVWSTMGESPYTFKEPLCAKIRRGATAYSRTCKQLKLRKGGRFRLSVRAQFRAKNKRYWSGSPASASLFRASLELASRQFHRILYTQRTKSCEGFAGCTWRYKAVVLLAPSQHQPWLKKALSSKFYEGVLAKLLYELPSPSTLTDPHDATNAKLLQLLSKAEQAQKDGKLFGKCAEQNFWDSLIYGGTQGLLLVFEALERYDLAQKGKTPARLGHSVDRSLVMGFLRSRYKYSLCKKGFHRANEAHRWALKSIEAKISGQPLPKRSFTYRVTQKLSKAISGQLDKIFSSWLKIEKKTKKTKQAKKTKKTKQSKKIKQAKKIEKTKKK